MKSLLNIMQIWLHEAAEIIRDKGILTFILFVPLVYPLLYSYVYTNEVVRDVPVVVVDDSGSSLSREIIRRMDATPDMRVAGICTDMEAAVEHIRRREAYGIVHIPAELTRELQQGCQVALGVYCDMSSMLYYKALVLAATNVSLEVNKHIKVRGYIPGSTDREDEVARTPIEYDYVALYNPQSGFAAFLIPPVLMLIIQQTLVLYMFVFVTDAFALPRLGRYTTFLAFAVPYVLACIFLAMVLSAFIYRREDCIMLLVFLSVPMLFLSGVSWPAVSMPRFWHWLSWLFPSTFGMNGYVKIASMGASLSDVRTEYMALWAQAGVYFLLACAFYRRQIRSLLKRMKPITTNT